MKKTNKNYSLKNKNFNALVFIVLALTSQHIGANNLTIIEDAKHDTSLPLPQLIRIYNNKEADLTKKIDAPLQTVPNILKNQKRLKSSNHHKFKLADNMKKIFLGSPMPENIISVDGIGKADAQSHITFPPDTNGDVGLQYYVQYINTNWAIFDKSNGNRLSDVMAGNIFWSGFGGVCEQDNAGDPLVLFDKHAQVWVFSQFGSFSSAENDNGGYQCFAISDRADLMDSNIVFHRYQYQFTGTINDYPHLGIWTDTSGSRSGYYMVTHDFSLPLNTATFQQASFSVFERDAMIAGNAARFLRFSDTTAFGNSAFGSLPAHLESVELPPSGMCAPFINNDRINGVANNAYYVLWQLCVDWININNSSLSPPTKLNSQIPFAYNVNRVPQPAPAPSGSELDNLSGQTMYKASARAYPAVSGMPVELVVNTTVNAGNGVAGIAWAHLSLPDNFIALDVIFKDSFENFTNNQNVPQIIQQGLHSPDTDSRWVGSIALDQSGNIGLAYTTSGASTFPSVRYTGRESSDPLGQLRAESTCVAGAGVQTAVLNSGRAGRWGDYSSMSIDPVDQCTFWSSVEYVATTGQTNWENRICSFRFPNCGDPDFSLRTTSSTTFDICTNDADPTIDLDIFAFGGFTSVVNLTASGLLGSSGISFANNPVNTFPSSISATLTNLENAGTNHMPFTIIASSTTPSITKTVDFTVNISNGIAASVSNRLPLDASADISLHPLLSWDINSNATEYLIEIASDSGFNTVIESQTTTDNSYTVTALLNQTTNYYWRITANNNCGIGTVSSIISFTTGIPNICPSGTSNSVVFNDNIEGDVSDWDISHGVNNGISTDTWIQDGSAHVNSGIGAFAALTPTNEDGDFFITDQYLISPDITLPDASQIPITLSYWNYQNMHTFSSITRCDDASTLEISTDGGTSFMKIENNMLETDPYNQFTESSNTFTAIPNTLAWCASEDIPEYGAQETISVVNLNQFAGQTVKFRFRFSSDPIHPDSFDSIQGWWIDDVVVKGCQ